SVGFVWLEARMMRRFSRAGAMWFHQVSTVAITLLAALLFPRFRHWTSAWFYLWTGSQAMILLPHFWVLALDVWDSRRARRVFPLLAGCGLLGGLAGGAYAGWATRIVHRNGLIWTAGGLLLVAHLLTRIVETHRVRRPGPAEIAAAGSRWDIIRGSRYIKVLVVALGLSVMASTLVDFQFKYYIQRIYPEPHALAQFLGRFYVGLNALALLFQFSAAGWLMQRLGLGPATGLQPVTAML